MITSNTYLYFAGNCEEALKFYAEVLGAGIDAMMKPAGTPMEAHCPPDSLDKIMHARFMIGEIQVMACDVPAQHYEKPQGFNINVSVDDPAEAERIYAALSQGGTQSMPIAETFWAQRFGTCVDRFGIPWMVNCEKAM